MTRLDYDGLDGSLMVPECGYDTAGLAALEKTQDGDQRTSLAYEHSKTTDLSAYSEPYLLTESLGESANKPITESSSDIEQSNNTLFYDETEPLLIEAADSEVNEHAISKNQILQRLSSTARADNKARTENTFDQEDAKDVVVPTLIDSAPSELSTDDSTPSPKSQTAPRVKKVLTILAVFVAGILLGGASLLAWLGIDKEIALVSSHDKPSGPILQRTTDIEPTEPAEAIVSRQTSEEIEKDVSVISDEEQAFDTLQPKDEGKASEQSFLQAQDHLVMDHKKPDQEIASSQSQSVVLQDKTVGNESSASTQQIAAAIPEEILPPSSNAQSTSWTIPFSFNSLSAPREILEGLREQFIGCDRGLLITGHTCSVGEADKNYYVGLARAKYVRNTLTDLGISSERLKVDSAGANQPVATNATEKGRRANRRVVISCR